ncbi:MAG: hypothetical protein ACRBN8_21190 [Nannocystales bacterium]
MSPNPTARQSLMRHTPIEHSLKDESIGVERRPFDARWIYSDLTKTSNAGFNPFVGKVFVPSGSMFAAWFDDPEADFRALNESDTLLYELYFFVHDYLHTWATRQIQSLLPLRGFGRSRVDEGNLEDYAFFMLITEACATVGGDYWWLSCTDLPGELNIGSRFRNLTVSYREEDEPEFRRFNREFSAQTPAFFGQIANFYNTGRFPGFDANDVRRSPILLNWLRHETTYGELQRRYSRAWLRHLGGLPLVSNAELDAPVACDEPWQQSLIRDIGERLWAKVKGGEMLAQPAQIPAEETWRAPNVGPIDFRFTNLASFDDPDGELERRGMVDDSRGHWVNQRLRLLDFPADDPAFRQMIPALRATVERDGGALFRWALSQKAPEVRGTEELRDIFNLC